MSMVYINNVNYYTRHKPRDTYVKHQNICFADLRREVQPISIRYFAQVHTMLTKDMVDYYLVLMKQLFGRCFRAVRVDWSKTSGEKKDERIVFIFRCAGMNHIQVLLRLTAFRYLAEFADVVKNTYRDRGNTPEENFLAFQKAHFTHRQCKDADRYSSNMSGHGLQYLFDDKAPTKIPLAEFHKRLGQKYNTVHEYFKP